MKKMSRIVCLAAVGALCVAMLAGCGNSSGSEATQSPSLEPTVAATPTVAPTPVATPTPEVSPSAEISPVASPEASASAGAEGESAEPSSESSAESSSAASDVLKLKDESDAVTEAQERLEALGYLDKVTGYYGTDTEKAVKEFQEKNDLDVDGKIGPNTLQVLMGEDAKKAS